MLSLLQHGRARDPRGHSGYLTSNNASPLSGFPPTNVGIPDKGAIRLQKPPEGPAYPHSETPRINGGVRRGYMAPPQSIPAKRENKLLVKDTFRADKRKCYDRQASRGTCGQNAVDRETQEILSITEDPKTDQRRLSEGTDQDGDHSLTPIPNDIGGTGAKPSDVTAFQDPLCWRAITELLSDMKPEEAHQVYQGQYVMELERKRGLISGDKKTYEKEDEETDKETGDDEDRHPTSAVKIDRQEGQKQLKSYKNNIQSLLPILEETWLDKEMSAFLTRYSVCPGGRSACNSNVFPRLELSPATAIILLVFALGKFCDWKAPFPEPGLVEARNLRREGFEGEDRIPGLRYYAAATSILGTVYGGTALGHIQAGILAALYASLAGYVYESSCWIDWACKGCHIHVRKRLDGERNDMVRLIFWTCIQLENDIPAELDLFKSGIIEMSDSSSEHFLKGAILVNSTKREDRMLYHSLLVQLCVLLSRIRSAVYQKVNSTLCDKLAGELETWRNALPQAYQWSDSVEPSANINAARMRAKYELARYIVHLHFLHQLLHRQTAHGKQSSINITTTAKSELCVRAAIRYTTAFDRLAKPPILENMFSIAHARFSILLVLSTTYRAGFTRLICQELLEELFQKSIDFLHDFQFKSPALAKEFEILQSVQEFLFPGANN